MASMMKKKRFKVTTPRESNTRDKHLKELIKAAVREVLAEERAIQGSGQQLLASMSREELVALALEAHDNWPESEGMGTSLDLVGRRQDEWKHRPN